MSSVNYRWMAQAINAKGCIIREVEKPSLTECFAEPVGDVFLTSTQTVRMSLVREKMQNGEKDIDVVNFDLTTGKPVGRFKKHNCNVPVTQVREFNAALLQLMRAGS